MVRIPAGAAVIAASLLLMLALASCTDDEQPVVAATTTVRVMQFNIEYGGTVVDFDSVPAAIEAADADVVAVQEGYGSMAKLAKALGWDYFDRRTQTVSQYPLITPSDPAFPEVLVAASPGRTFALINVHLPSTGYGPNKAATGASADELIAGEKGRLKALQPAKDAVARLHVEGTPVVLTGDFNAPSHLDWIEATDGQRDHVSPVQWPVSMAVEDAGLTDAYRAVHPDPATDEGLTWPASRPKSGSYNPGPAGKPADRIDQMYTSSDIAVTDAEIVGEKKAADTDIAVTPWPSDHRAVVTELDVPLVPAAPYLSPAQRLVDQGDDVEVFAYSDPAPDSIVVTGAESGDSVTVQDVPDLQTIIVDTTDLAPGEYEVSARGADEAALASATMWVKPAGADPALLVDKTTVAVGETIDVAWNNAPGNKWDWLGVYRRGADPDQAWYKNWTYTGATIVGSATIDDTVDGGPWPLPPGKYDVLLLADDSYAELARASFTVEKR